MTRALGAFTPPTVDWDKFAAPDPRTTARRGRRNFAALTYDGPLTIAASQHEGEAVTRASLWLGYATADDHYHRWHQAADVVAALEAWQEAS